LRQPVESALLKKHKSHTFSKYGARRRGYDVAVINGVHAIVFSREAEKVRTFLGDVLGLSSVDAGHGWLIFALPPAELAVHPADGESRHELYLMCDDIHATLEELRGKGVPIAREVSDQRWGLVAAIRLPDGEEFPIYEPRHPSPLRP
jgi:catechol 2,3-dioxygenase-like lactoylglutathione lyase family enzyme